MSKESLTNKTFKGFFWTAGGKISTAVLQIVVIGILARLINAESFGIVQAALIVVGFAKILTEVGIGPALVQIRNINKTHIRVGFTFSLVLGLSIGLIIFFCSGLLADFFNMPELTLVIKVISSIFLFESVITVSASLIQRDMKLKEKSIIEIISYFVGYGVFGIILGYLGYDYWALIIAILVQAAIKLISYLIIQKHSLLLTWKKNELKELLQFAGGYTLGRVFSKLASEADNIVTGKYIGAEALGLYSRAYTIMAKPLTMLGDALNITLFPAMAARQYEKEKLKRVFINGSRFLLFPSIILSFVVFRSSNEIIMIILGKGWEKTVIPLQILALGMFFRLGYKLGSELSKATGFVNKRALYLFFFGIFSVVGSFIGARYGINGVAIGVLFAMIINYILLTNLGLSIINLSWRKFIKQISRDILTAVVLGIVFLFVYRTVEAITSVPWFLLSFSYFIYGILLMILFLFYGSQLKFLKLLPVYDRILNLNMRARNYLIRFFSKTKNMQGAKVDPVKEVSSSSRRHTILLDILPDLCVCGYSMKINKDPMVESLKIKDDFDIFREFYKNFTPSTINELLRINLGNKFGEVHPNKIVFPWESQNPESKFLQRKKTFLEENKKYGGSGLSLEKDGHTDYGPISLQKLNLEIGRINDIYSSIKSKGFILEAKNRSGIKGYILLSSNNEYRIYIKGGKHRAKILAALNYEFIPVEIKGQDIVYEDRIEEWHQVRKGLYSVEEARHIFKSFF